jgi:alkylhydroperoxidase family enzyme
MNQTAELNETPLITPYPPQGEETRVENVLGAIQEHIGFIPDGLKLYSFSPPLLESFVGNITYFNGETSIPPSLMAMIRYLVSAKADCTFCIDMNEGFLANMGIDLKEVRAARTNPDLAPFSDREKSLLKLSLKAVDSPLEVGEQDLQEVRQHGWSDRDIFDAVVQANNNRAFNNILRTFNIEHQGVFS